MMESEHQHPNSSAACSIRWAMGTPKGHRASQAHLCGVALKQADLEGKKVYPFATNGGWLGHTMKDFEKLCKGAKVKEGVDVRFDGAKQRTSDAEIQRWIKTIR